MKSHEAEAGEAEFIVGRDGLKLPNINFESEGRTLNEAAVLDFFYNLWELNGEDPHIDRPWVGGRSKPRQYSHELVLPASDDKLLVVIRGKFDPKDSADLVYELRNYRENRWRSNFGISHGIEKHSILFPPKERGLFVPFLEVTDTHQQGGNSLSNGISLIWQNQPVREKDYEADISQLDVQEYWRQTRENYSKFISGILRETVEFLS